MAYNPHMSSNAGTAGMLSRSASGALRDTSGFKGITQGPAQGGSAGFISSAARAFLPQQQAFFQSVNYFLNGAPVEPPGWNTDDYFGDYVPIKDAFAKGTIPAYQSPVYGQTIQGQAPMSGSDITSQKVAQLYENYNQFVGAQNAGNGLEGNYDAYYAAKQNLEYYGIYEPYAYQGIDPEAQKIYMEGYQQVAKGVQSGVKGILGVSFGDSSSSKTKTS